MSDPTTSLRRALADYGLHPPEIIWDGALRRFPGKAKNERNKAAWYVAHPDRQGACFGDFSQSLNQVNWKAKRERPPTQADWDKWKRQGEERVKARGEKMALARQEVDAAWAAAKAVTEERMHPYLVSKGITNGIDQLRVLETGTEGLIRCGRPYCVREDTLLVPMHVNGELANVQRISPNGEKRYWPEALVTGAAHVIGATFYEHTKVVYLCEGWATGASISEVAGVASVVVFSAGGLLPVAKRVREKYPEAKLIIAADNDRWSTLHDDTPNPGVHFARKAAAGAGADVAIPDFRILASRPTDFNDLHQLEGAEAVKKWLSPKNASKAVTMPDTGRARGRGCWRDENGDVVLHLGDRLLLPKRRKFVKLRIEGAAPYKPRPRLAGPSVERGLTVDECRHLLDLFAYARWAKEAAGYLLAGWTALAPFSGALPWRSHVLLTGDSHGRLTMIDHMVKPLLGKMAILCTAGSTEAGIHQRLRGDALPVIYDDADDNSPQAHKEINGILALARSASSTGSRIGNGTPNGKRPGFEINSMFLLSSIEVGHLQRADKTRFSVLRLKSLQQLDARKRRDLWNAVQREFAQHSTVENGRRLLARTARWMRTGQFDELRDLTLSAAITALKDARYGEQYATLAAGAWMLMTDDIPSEMEVVDWFNTIGVSSLLAEGGNSE